MGCADLCLQVKDFLKFELSAGALAANADASLYAALINVSAANAEGYFRKSGHMAAYDAAVAEEELTLAALALLI